MQHIKERAFHRPLTHSMYPPLIPHLTVKLIRIIQRTLITLRQPTRRDPTARPLHQIHNHSHQRSNTRHNQRQHSNHPHSLTAPHPSNTDRPTHRDEHQWPHHAQAQPNGSTCATTRYASHNRTTKHNAHTVGSHSTTRTNEQPTAHKWITSCHTHAEAATESQT